MNETSETEFDPKDPAGYICWREEIVRFNDLDPHWHMTSTAHMTMFESSRILFIRRASEASKGNPRGWMLMNANISYHSQVHFPANLRVGTRLDRIGRSSVRILQGLFNGDVCVSTVDGTVILADPGLSHSIPVPDDVRDNLKRLSETGDWDGL